ELLLYESAGGPQSLPTRRSSDLDRPENRSVIWRIMENVFRNAGFTIAAGSIPPLPPGTNRPPTTGRCARCWNWPWSAPTAGPPRSEEHTSELQSREKLVCRLRLE